MLRIPLMSKAQLERRQTLPGMVEACEREIAALSKATTPADKAKLEHAKVELAALTKELLIPVPYANGAQEGGCPKSAHAGIHDVPVHIRGRYDRLGALVHRHFPVILAGDNRQGAFQGSGRMELARWIASEKNPLTSRVIVNRIWQHHFGEGLVRTPGNFGKLGEPPMNPELLDYLAGLF